MSEPVDKPPRRRVIRIGFLLVAIGIVIFVCLFSIGYFQLIRANYVIGRLLINLQIQTANQQQTIDQLTSSLKETQATVQKNQEVLTKQEQLLDLNKWYIAEAHYLVRSANDQVQLTHNIPMAITLLQQANEVLLHLSNVNLFDLRKSIATDITNLQSIPQIDITSIYLQVSALNSQIDHLPLPTTPLKPDNTISVTDTSQLPWWKAGLQNTWHALSKIVVVHYTTPNDQPLVMPDEKAFLYQNLHARMENAAWAVLHGNQEIFQDNIKLVIDWTHRYFDQDAQATKSLLQNLQALQKINVQSPSVDLTETLKLFDQYFDENRVAQ